jgi:hypothetical protein
MNSIVQPITLPQRLSRALATPLLWAAHAAAWCLGGVLGFGFGLRLAGVGLAVVTALLTALCLSLFVDAAALGLSNLRRRWDARGKGPADPLAL